ncbi:MAG: DUF4384 domain-containing protein [Sulfuritalea sp.]|nr:DUF4384 domain-containing protein [Sulfuritalea sp.]
MKHWFRFAAVGVVAIQTIGSGVALAEGVRAKAAFLDVLGRTQMTAGTANVPVPDVAPTPPAPIETAAQIPVAQQTTGTVVGAVAPVATRPAARQRPAPAGAPGYTGMAFWVEVTTKDQRTMAATTDRVFQSGETVRLHFKPNAAGYLYVFNKGSTGRTRLLYPAQGESNAVKAGAVVTVPGPGNVMRFDSNPGREQLVAVMSRAPLGGVIPAVATPASSVPSAPPSGPHLLVTTLDTERLDADLSRVRSKDIVLERDPKPRDGLAPASYVVAPRSDLEQGRIITVTINLQHK